MADMTYALEQIDEACKQKNSSDIRAAENYDEIIAINKFISLARTALPELVARVRELEAELKHMRNIAAKIESINAGRALDAALDELKQSQAENAALRNHIVDISKKVESAEEYALQRYLVWEKTLSENHRDDAQRATANAVMGAYKGLGKMLCDIGQAIASAGYGRSEGGAANE